MLLGKFLRRSVSIILTGKYRRIRTECFALLNVWTEKGLAPILHTDVSPAMRTGFGRQKYFPADIEISGAADGVIAFKKGGLWGYYDTAGELIIQPKYH